MAASAKLNALSARTKSPAEWNANPASAVHQLALARQSRAALTQAIDQLSHTVDEEHPLLVQARALDR